MSGGTACKCSEREERFAPADGSNRPGRLWRVTQLKCNHSAFNGYHRTPSNYSSVRCLRCGAAWRTLSDYVFRIPAYDIDTEINISPGVAGYAEIMESAGRTPYVR